MALTLYEASNILSMIRAHHGDMQLTQTDVEIFASELLPSMTLMEARAAVIEYYSIGRTRWCQAGDVNDIVRKHRATVRPSEAQIGRECERLGLNADQSWMYRRQRMLGRTPETAALKAREWHPQLEAAPSKQKPRDTRKHFNPNLGVDLAQVVTDHSVKRV